MNHHTVREKVKFFLIVVDEARHFVNTVGFTNRVSGICNSYPQYRKEMASFTDVASLTHFLCPPIFIITFFKDFIYLFMRHRERERQRHRQGKKQAPCREPDVGLDPRTPGSCPGLKAALNR